MSNSLTAAMLQEVCIFWSRPCLSCPVNATLPVLSCYCQTWIPTISICLDNENKAEILKRWGREWKLLSPEGKDVYIQRAKDRKEGNIDLNDKEKRRLATQLFGNLQAVVCYTLGPLCVFTVPMAYINKYTIYESCPFHCFQGSNNCTDKFWWLVCIHMLHMQIYKKFTIIFSQQD